MPILITTTIRRHWEQARIHSPSATRIVSASLRRASRIGRMTGALLIVVAGCLSFASQASATDTCGTHGVLSAVGDVYSCTYTTSGEDTFNVPLFVTAVHVVAVGQTGGTACAFEGIRNTGDGGSGARVAAGLPVTQPTLFAEVPFSTPPASGCGGQSQITLFGGGGGGNGTALGGGASVVQRCSVNTSCLLTGVPQTDPRLVVAGGGGGAAFDGINGGDAGTGGNPVCNPGLSGQTGPNAVDGRGGSGGSCQSFGAGGQGGTGPSGFSTDGLMGDDGWIGIGGDGGAIALDPVPNPACSYPWPGAGGGVGFWGGGGGGGAAYCSGGGGGGGSSYAEPVATNVSMTLAPSVTPSVTISWVQPVNREYQFLTGRAFGLSFTQSPPNPAFSLTSADTGFISTSQTATFSAPCVPILSEPVGAPGTTTIAEYKVCAEVKTTGGAQLQSTSIATSSTGILILRIPGLPIVRARTVISASKTTCAGSTGATFISYLSIGGDVVISHPQVVAPNTDLTVGQFNVNLNAQTPFTLPADKGLIVDGLELSFGPPSSVTGHLIVASSESDIGDCPGQLPVS
jgi:hypothetical protein